MLEKDIKKIKNDKSRFFKVLVKMLFKQYDRDKNNSLDVGELDRAVCELFHKLDVPEPKLDLIQETMNKYDKGKGEVKEKQLRSIIKDLLELQE